MYLGRLIAISSTIYHLPSTRHLFHHFYSTRFVLNESMYGKIINKESNCLLLLNKLSLFNSTEFIVSENVKRKKPTIQVSTCMVSILYKLQIYIYKYLYSYSLIQSHRKFQHFRVRIDNPPQRPWANCIETGNRTI